MDDDCEGNGSIPASSFARAAAALALESKCSNELPDSDSSISESSQSGGDHDEDGSCNSSNQLHDNSHENNLQQSPSELSSDGDNINEVQIGANNSRSSEHLQEYSALTRQEMTPEASNTAENIGLFESDSTVENRGSNQQQLSAKKLGESVNEMNVIAYSEDHVYNLCPTYANSSASIADSSFSFMASPSPSTRTPQTKNSEPKSVNTEQSSLLSRGLNLFGRRAAAASSRSNNNISQSYNDDSSSVISDISHDARSVRSSATLRTASSAIAIANQRIRDDTRMQKHLKESGLNLVKRLIEFLSACPPAPDEEQIIESNGLTTQNAKSKKPRGLTLPASAVGWVSFQMTNLEEDVNLSYSNNLEDLDCYQVPKQQLQVLQMLLRRVTSLRLTNDKWPPPLPPLISDAADMAKRKAFSSIPETGTVSSRILSKFTDQSSIAGIHSVADDSVSTGTARETIVTPLQRYFHELQYNPNIDMRLFPYASKVVADGIPPHWISHLDTLHNLDVFQMEKGCILDVNQLLFPSDAVDSASVGDDSSLFMYKSVTKLHLSNCAINEAAGLRGRRRPRSLDASTFQRVPTLSRFPNLHTLDLSHNELFRTKSALAGLSSLPLLSSINLSYNRLSSMAEIFMHVGNVKELILSGNEISSTQGLDRLFSLERLSLDGNKIEHLFDISNLAKLPFLMALDIKGNPFEVADSAACRIEVYNLFREVRCKSMSKHATYRDMQQLLPTLDNELANKDELVAIKNLTFRQAVALDIDDPGMEDSAEIKVNILGNNRDHRRVAKLTPSRTVHCRDTALLFDGKPIGQGLLTDEHAFAFDNHVQYKLEDVIASIRPIIESGDNSTQPNLDSYERSRTRSSFSLGKFDGNIDEHIEKDFPFILPASILDHAEEDTFNPVPLYKTLPAYEPPEQDDELLVEPDVKNITDGMVQSTLSCDQDSTFTDVTGKASDAYGINKDANEKEDPFEASAEPESNAKSVFGGIWEQTYRDNMRIGPDALDTDNSTIDTPSSQTIDYDAEELNAVYDGPLDYIPIFVSSDLDLYYETFVFPRSSDDDSQEETVQNDKAMYPRIQLFKFDRSALHERSKTQEYMGERYIGVWREDVIACGAFACSRVQPINIPRRGFHGEIITQSGKDAHVSESRKIVVCLSDSALYLVVDDDVVPKQKLVQHTKRAFPSRIPVGATFEEAYWPHALISHSLDCLVGITIGFQFQRLLLRFSVSNANGMALEYTYVLLTSNKLHTISLLQKLQSHVSEAQSTSVERQAVLIENDDKAFLDALGARTDEVVLHYQILRQFWKRGDREAARRSFVLTDTTIYLLDESYDGDGGDSNENVRRLGDVSLSIIDSASLNRVTEVRAANEDPRMITLVILPLNKIKRNHRWRLLCNDGEGAERLIDDVRKAIGSHT